MGFMKAAYFERFPTVCDGVLMKAKVSRVYRVMASGIAQYGPRGILLCGI